MAAHLHPSSDDEQTRGVSRRAVSSAVAWTVPVVAVAVGAPLAAASPATAGTIVFSPAIVSGLPGGTFPATTITATGTGGTIDNALTFVLNLPTGLTFADGSTAKTITIPASNATTATFELSGPVYGITALATDAIGSSYTPTTTAAPAGWPMTVNEFSIVASVVPVASTGLMWGQNGGNGNFVNGGSPNLAATALDLPAGGTWIDVVTYGGGQAIRSDDTIWSPQISSTVVQYTGSDVPTLQPGEHYISAAGQDSVLTNYGRAFHLRIPATAYQYTFTDATYAPTGAFITAMSLMSSDGGGLNGTYFLDSAGRVWQTSGSSGAVSGSDYSPKLVTDGANPITGITQISAGSNGALALTATGKVYSITSNINATASFQQQTSGGVTSDLTDVVSLAEMSSDIYPTPGQGWGVIKNDGTVWSWGSGNNFRHTPADSNSVTYAQLNTQASRVAGTPVKLAFAYGTSFLIMSDNSVWSWGGNNLGSLGQNISSDTSTSSVFPDPGRVVDGSGAGIFATRFWNLYAAMGVAKA